MGQLVVVMFLFYSGYGIGESYKKKGVNYVQQMPVHRILTTLLNLLEYLEIINDKFIFI